MVYEGMVVHTLSTSTDVNTSETEGYSNFSKLPTVQEEVQPTTKRSIFELPFIAPYRRSTRLNTYYKKIKDLKERYTIHSVAARGQTDSGKQRSQWYQ